MARQIIISENQPQTITVGDQSVKICMCGLSKNLPYCDDSEKATLDEMDGVVYTYDKDNNKTGAYEISDDENDSTDSGCAGGCCGGNCCGND